MEVKENKNDKKKNNNNKKKKTKNKQTNKQKNHVAAPRYNGAESLLGKKGGHRQRHGNVGEFSHEHDPCKRGRRRETDQRERREMVEKGTRSPKWLDDVGKGSWGKGCPAPQLECSW